MAVAVDDTGTERMRDMKTRLTAEGVGAGRFSAGVRAGSLMAASYG